MKDWDLQTLFDRGMLDDAIVRDELFDDIANGKRLTIYQGLDPTSPNMHIGHLVGLRVLRWFQLHGHHVILLIGDFTGRIGDPSDRPEARKRLTHAQVLVNAETYAEQFSRIFDLDGENPAQIQYNSRWLDNITLAEFIEIMDKFTVQQLLERSMFQERIKKQEALYLNEMIYPILQGYDSVAMEVDAELGGSDQLFNMMRGRDLVEAYLGKTKHVLTTQLLEGLDGRKMSKTYGNTVDLTEDPVPMFFKLTLVQDSKLPRFMQVLTDRTDDEIAAVEGACQDRAQHDRRAAAGSPTTSCRCCIPSNRPTRPSASSRGSSTRVNCPPIFPIFTSRPTPTARTESGSSIFLLPATWCKAKATHAASFSREASASTARWSKTRAPSFRHRDLRAPW